MGVDKKAEVMRRGEKRSPDLEKSPSTLMLVKNPSCIVSITGKEEYTW
jgi:hypothetical protein